MSNSSLVTYTNITKNCSKRVEKIEGVAIHCYVGQVTAKQGCDMFATTTRQASANYVIGKDGSIGLSVPEEYRAWTTSSNAVDQKCVTIEVASDTVHPYKVTDAAYNALIELLVDICKRNGIKQLLWKADKSLMGQYDKQNMVVHRWTSNKLCPGDFLFNLHGTIAETVSKRLGAPQSTQKQDTAVTTVDEVAKLVQKYSAQNNIKVNSVIIAQAILESGWFKSELAVNAKNLFGLKYTAGRVKSASGYYNKVGSEQNADGSYTSSAMQWCKFNSIENCVKGYFEFIANSRYDKLRTVTTADDYAKALKECGYATSLKYAENLMKVVKDNNLTKYDNAAQTQPQSQTKKGYRVQAGAFSKEANCKAYVEKIKKAGFDAIIRKDGSLYKVQAGYFNEKKNAEALVTKLKKAGFDAIITS